MKSIRDYLWIGVAFLAVFTFLMLLPTPESAEDDDSVLIAGVTLFDGESFRKRMDVWVDAGQVRAIGRHLKVDAGVKRIDGKGRTLLPGLIDAHTHVWGEALNQALDFGVTTELDMFTDYRLLQAARPTRDNLDRPQGADLFSAGTLVTAPGGHGTEFGLKIPTLSSPEDAEAFVAARLAEGSDYIKVVFDNGSAYGLDIPTLDDATFESVVQAARSQNALVVVHVGTLDSARKAAKAGAHGLVHLFADQAVDQAFIDLALEKELFVIPTLSVLTTLTGVDDDWFKGEGVSGHLDATQRQGLESRFQFETELAADLPVKNLRALHEAGVPILAGTDAPNPGTAHGVSLHRELQLLNKAGMSVEETLKAATSGPARYFPLGDRGRIATGSRADLLLIDGDPRDNIENSVRIVGIWKNGFAIDRRAAADPAMAPSLASGLVSDFDSDLSSTGHGWQVTTDQIRGGTSSAEQAWISGGMDSNGGSLRVTGEVSSGFAFPWAGTVWFPGAAPMQPVAASPGTRISFAVRGDGAEYHLLFLSTNQTPPVRYAFTAEQEWRNVMVSLDDLNGLDLGQIAGVAFAAGPQPGPFEFEIDNVTVQ